MNSPASCWAPQRQDQHLQRELSLDLVFFVTTWVAERVCTHGCQCIAGINDHLVSEYSSQKQARKLIKMERSIELKRKSQRQQGICAYLATTRRIQSQTMGQQCIYANPLADLIARPASWNLYHGNIHRGRQNSIRIPHVPNLSFNNSQHLSILFHLPILFLSSQVF